MELADGTRNAFAEFKGKVLILDFYATWCEPCRNSIPHLVGLQQRYQNEVRVIGLNVGGPGDTQLVPEFAKEFKINIHSVSGRGPGQPSDGRQRCDSTDIRFRSQGPTAATFRGIRRTDWRRHRPGG